MVSFKQYLLDERNNAHLTRAKYNKDDEFYTSYSDAKLMLTPFSKKFSGKSILCNCDAPDRSQVYKFMKDNFKQFGLKKLVGVGYGSYMEIVDGDGVEQVEVTNGGDFRTGESVEALRECDIVISNPPFSSHMFIDFIKLVLDNGKDLVAIGPLTGAKAVDVKPFVISGRLNVIYSPYQKFTRPDGSEAEAQVVIYTTFDLDPFSTEVEFSFDKNLEDLPVDDKFGLPVSINHKDQFSIVGLPIAKAGEKIIVPLGIFRKRWSEDFKIIDILNTVHLDGKKLMPGVIMQYK